MSDDSVSMWKLTTIINIVSCKFDTWSNSAL